MIASLDNLSTNIELQEVFDLGDKLICHPELATRFGSVARKTPATVVATTALGVIHQECMIVELPKDGQSNWRCKEGSVMSKLKKGESWIFTMGESTTPSTSKGITANLLRAKIRVSKIAVAVVPKSGAPFQAYYFRRES